MKPRSESSEGPVWTLGRSLGSAVRLVRQLVPRRRLPGGPSTASDSGSKVLRDYERTRRRLLAEAAQLEAEVERLHAMITNHSMPGIGEGATRLKLNELLDESRQKRELLHEKRQQLARIERHMTRERRLSPLESPDVNLRRGQAPPASSSGPSRRSRAANTPGRRAAVAKAAANGTFGNRGQQLAFKRAAERLLDENAEVRREAVTQLSRLGGPNVPELLMSAAEDSSERVRLAALNALVGSNHRAAAEVFRRFLHDKNPALRLSALRGLATLNARLMPNGDLIARLEDSDAAIRRTSANILGWRRDPNVEADVIHALTLVLRDSEEEVRVAAAEALGNLGDHRGVLALFNALEDAAASVSEAAERALRSVLGETIDSVGQGLPKSERVVALKEWWKDARAEAYLALHAAELPIDKAAEPPAPPPPRPRPAPEAQRAEPIGVPAKQAQPSPPKPAPAEVAPRKPAAPKEAPVQPAPAKETPKKAAAEKPAPQVAPAASADIIADAFAEAEGPSEESLGLGADESGEDFENMFAGGETEETAEAESAANEPKPGERAEEGQAEEGQAEEGQAEEGEEGGFEDIFGGEEQ